MYCILPPLRRNLRLFIFGEGSLLLENKFTNYLSKINSKVNPNVEEESCEDAERRQSPHATHQQDNVQLFGGTKLTQKLRAGDQIQF